MPTRVAAVQTALRKGSYSKAVDDAQALIREAARSGARIVCLPEHWLLEYREQGYKATERLADTAKEERIFIITGANYFPAIRADSSELRVRSLLIGPDGQTIGHQDKVHLFRSEKTVAGPAEGFAVFETTVGKVGITVCYDNVFPEACRTLALKGADLLFVPSRIVFEGLDPWVLYLRARALENRMPVVAPNIFDPPRYVGGSVVIDLDFDSTTHIVAPKIVASAGSGERVIVADVDIERARELRVERLSERRPAAYSGPQS